MEALLKQFESEIKSIVVFAKATNFDSVTGDYSQLMRDWLEAGRKANDFIEDNKEEVLKAMKFLVNK